MRGEHRWGSAVDRGFAGSSPHARGTPGQPAAGKIEHRFIPACAGNTRTRRTRCAWNSVHPRMRGEHVGTLLVVMIRSGSSPHARGTLLGNSLGCGLSRFIPACAGNTNRHNRFCSWPSVHPRMRGEHVVRVQIERHRNGSSPHARGTRPADPVSRDERRFIPACAGNTHPTMNATVMSTVHPRMRGEHTLACSLAAHSVGSSPHARGTLPRARICAAIRRFIPACAGNTGLLRQAN